MRFIFAGGAPSAEQAHRPLGNNAPVPDPDEPAATTQAALRDDDAYSTRQKAISLAVALLLLASVVLGIVVFGGGDGSDDAGALASADGVLTLVQPDRLRMQLQEPLDGQSTIDFVVRPEDRAQLDIAHLQVHASDGLPTRIFYERDEGRYAARSAVDLP